MSFKLSRRSYDRLTGVDPRLIYLCDEAIKKTPVDFGIAHMGGRRTAEEQKQLFDSGFSTKDGYNKLSKHQSGQAFDFIPFVNGRVDMSEHYFFMIVSALFVVAKDLGLHIRSGGNWNEDEVWKTDQHFFDVSHIELMI